MNKLILKLSLAFGCIALAFTACQKNNPDCTNLQLNYGDTCLISVGNRSVLGLVDTNCNCDSTLFPYPSPTYDCPTLLKNYGDNCVLGGVNGTIDNNCNCDTTTQTSNWDCPTLQLNFGDSCRLNTFPGGMGIVDTNCNCI